jgi:hypothetical protein
MAARKKKTNINLLIQQDHDESISGQILSWALTYGRYIIIITQIVVLSVFFMRFKLDRDHTDLKESVTQKQVLVESVTDLETEIRGIQSSLANISKITKGQPSVLKVLNFLQDAAPSDMQFTTLTLKKDVIAFNASTVNLRTFNFLLRQLQQNNRFSDVSLQNILRRTDGHIEFSIEAKINPKSFI